MIEINENDLPITVADKLISATKLQKTTPWSRLGRVVLDRGDPGPDEDIRIDAFDLDDLEEIANYLWIYVSINKGKYNE